MACKCPQPKNKLCMMSVYNGTEVFCQDCREPLEEVSDMTKRAFEWGKRVGREAYQAEIKKLLGVG